MLKAICAVCLTLGAAAADPPSYEVGRFLRHYRPVTSVVLAPDGEVVSVSDDGKVRRWDLKTQKQQGDEPFQIDVGRVQLAISPNGELLAAAWQGREFCLWVRTYSKAAVYNRGDEGDQQASVAFSPDGKWLAVGMLEGGIGLWDISHTYENGTFSTSYSDRKGEIKDAKRADALVYSPSSKALLVLGKSATGYEVEVRDLVQQTRVAAAEADGPALAFAPNGSSFVTGRRLMRLGPNDKPGPIEAYFPQTAAVYAPDASWLATGSVDNCLTFWEVASGKPVARLRAHDHAINALALTPDGTQLVSASDDGTVRIWDVKRILAERPFDRPLAKLAKVPKAYEAWRLGLCWSRGVLGAPAGQDQKSLAEEAQKIAKQLGVELPAFPTSDDLQQNVKLLSDNQARIANHLEKSLGQMQSRLFLTGAVLPLFGQIFYASEEAYEQLSENVLSKMGAEFVSEFGALPSMFETFDRALEQEDFDQLEDSFEWVARELDLNLEMQCKSAAGAAQSEG